MGHSSVGVLVVMLVILVLVMEDRGLGVLGARGVRTRSPHVVHTKYGELRGVITNLGSRVRGNVEAFLGIPYASPPLGNLRLMPPGTPSPWSNIKEADRMGPVCPQRLPDIRNETEALKNMSRGRYQYLRRLLPYLKNQSEDCLYLNIFTPVGVNERRRVHLRACPKTETGTIVP
ncbi:neuroligin 4-like [Oratosquilla oratoria]|uniref:neuroligin 4-like n=1 Tax=Oratosquilla oratoria TaxID=337810 RepID=UPI003F75FCD4